MLDPDEPESSKCVLWNHAFTRTPTWGSQKLSGEPVLRSDPDGGLYDCDAILCSVVFAKYTGVMHTSQFSHGIRKGEEIKRMEESFSL